MGIFKKLFGSPSQREMARLQPIVDEVLAKEEHYAEMDNDELAGMTDVLKKRLDEEFGSEEEPDTEHAQLPALR